MKISRLVFLILLFVNIVHAQAWSGVLSSARGIDWSVAGVSGGIPSATWTQCGSTIAAYGSAGTPGSPSTIQTAINACGANQYVQLGAGNFYLSGSFYFKGLSNIEIRGQGANSTFIYFYGNTGVAGDNCQGLYATVCFESSDTSSNQSPSNSANWTAGYSQGTSVITLSAVTNLKVGNPVILDELISSTDNGSVLEQNSTTNGNPFTSPGSPGPYTYTGGEVRPGRGLTHVYTVAGCDGSTTVGHQCVSTSVTISPAIVENYWNSGLSPQAWWPTSPTRNAGVQNMSIDGTNSGCGAGNGFGIAFWNTINVWESGVRDVNECRTHTMVQYSARATIRNNYFFLARFASSTSYGLECFGASDTLFENNILQAMAGPMTVQEGCVGFVMGYNFDLNTYYPNSPPTLLAMGNNHGIGSDLDLWEGNVGGVIEFDVAHGTKNFDTAFRNRFAGTNPVCWSSGANPPSSYADYLAATWGTCTSSIRALEISAFARFANVVGNVLGTTGTTASYDNLTTSCTGNCVYLIDTGQNSVPDGADPPTATTLYRWGNCDDVHGFSAANCQFNNSEVPVSGSLSSSQQPWAQTIPASHTLPASFYYSSKPSWWPSTKAWPPIGPDVTGGNISGTGGLAYTIPAQDCYLSLTGATTDGTLGPFPFDASVCYSGSSSPSNGVTMTGGIKITGGVKIK